MTLTGAGLSRSILQPPAVGGWPGVWGEGWGGRERPVSFSRRKARCHGNWWHEKQRWGTLKVGRLQGCAGGSGLLTAPGNGERFASVKQPRAAGTLLLWSSPVSEARLRKFEFLPCHLPAGQVTSQGTFHIFSLSPPNTTCKIGMIIVPTCGVVVQLEGINTLRRLGGAPGTSSLS